MAGFRDLTMKAVGGLVIMNIPSVVFGFLIYLSNEVTTRTVATGNRIMPTRSHGYNTLGLQKLLTYYRDLNLLTIAGCLLLLGVLCLSKRRPITDYFFEVILVGTFMQCVPVVYFLRALFYKHEMFGYVCFAMLSSFFLGGFLVMNIRIKNGFLQLLVFIGSVLPGPAFLWCLLKFDPTAQPFSLWSLLKNDPAFVSIYLLIPIVHLGLSMFKKAPTEQVEERNEAAP